MGAGAIPSGCEGGSEIVTEELCVSTLRNNIKQ